MLIKFMLHHPKYRFNISRRATERITSIIEMQIPLESRSFLMRGSLIVCIMIFVRL